MVSTAITLKAMRNRKLSDYGYVVRGQVATYSVPISPIAGIPNAACASPCGSQGKSEKGTDFIEFCKRHKCGCLIAAGVIAYLLLGR